MLDPASQLKWASLELDYWHLRQMTLILNPVYFTFLLAFLLAISQLLVF